MESQQQPAQEKTYRNPSLTCDSIVTKKNPEDASKTMILLITRGKDPFKGHYAFPGGFVDYGEDPENAVLRELQEECNITGKEPELICVAGKPDRDPRRHVVTIAYHVEVDPTHEVKAGDDAATAQWYDLKDVRENYNMAFDHKDILNKFIAKMEKEGR